MSLSVAEKVKRQMDSGFRYVSDKERTGRFEYWNSATDAVNGTWEGDCDDYALTAAELLIERGVDPSAVRIAYCHTETGDGHLVCLVDGVETTYAIDNRQSGVWMFSSLPYKWISAMDYASKTWRAING